MKKTILLAALVVSTAAFAQSTTTTTTTRETTTFTPAQETTIRKYVTQQKARPVTVKERVVVGATIPTEVELDALPSDIVTEVPSARSYRYFSTDAGVAIVDPSSRRVVRVISE